MKYTPDEVIQYVQEEDVKFIRMAFCDVYGKQRNVAIMPTELPRAFEYGIAVDASAIPGFHMGPRSDLFLRPNAETLKELPWRPQHGRVAHMFCDILHPVFLPRQTRTEERGFPWHDFLVYVITTAPIIATLVFAKELIMAHAFAPMGFASVLWFWFVFMVNTKLRGVFR